MPTFESMRKGYANLWRQATIKPGADDALASNFAHKIIAAAERYRAVQARTGVPWFFVGALHMRESSCDFDGVLHNGEKIIGTGRQTSLEPPHRGPFASWEEAAVDALELKNLHRVQAWSIERMLYHAEEFNGWGYVGKGVNSPYVWAGTTLEQTGKYVADHVWSATFDDPQIGAACVLKRLAELRPDIGAVLDGGDDEPAATVPATVDPAAAQVLPAAGDLAAGLARIEAMMLFALVKDELSADDRAAARQAMLQRVLGTARTITMPAAPATTPAATPVTPPASTPAATAPASTDKTVAGASLIALILSGLGMATGTIAPPIGDEATAASTAALVAPLIAAVAGSTGLASPIVGFGIRFLSALGTALQKQQSKP